MGKCLCNMAFTRASTALLLKPVIFRDKPARGKLLYLSTVNFRIKVEIKILQCFIRANMGAFDTRSAVYYYLDQAIHLVAIKPKILDRRVFYQWPPDCVEVNDPSICDKRNCLRRVFISGIGCVIDNSPFVYCSKVDSISAEMSFSGVRFCQASKAS